MAQLDNERLLWAFIRVNPNCPEVVAKDQIVDVEKKMTVEQFDKSLNHLLKQKHLKKHSSNKLTVTSRTPPINFGYIESPHREAVRLKFPKTRTHKAHAVIIKRKYIEGYKCRKCGAFIDRAWSKPRIRKCRSCGVKTYYRKSALVKSLRTEEKLTKKGKQLIKVARESAWKIKMPTLKELKINPDQIVDDFQVKSEAQRTLDGLRKAGDDKPYRILQARDSARRKTLWFIIYDPTLPKAELPRPRMRGRPRVHLKREKYPGSKKASDAAHKAWATRRTRKEQVTVGFYKDNQNRTRPLTKSVAELNRKKIIREPKKFKGVRPKKR